MDVERVCLGVRFVHVAGESVKGRALQVDGQSVDRDADKVVLWFPPLPSLFDINEHWRSIDGQARRYLVC